MPGQARRCSAGHRHGEHVEVVAVLGAERDRRSIRREHRIRLDAVIAGQAADVASIQVSGIEIPRVDERDVGGADRGLGEQLRIRRVHCLDARLVRRIRRRRGARRGKAAVFACRPRQRGAPGRDGKARAKYSCGPKRQSTMQEQSYPRSVHGCLLLAGAVAVWLCRL